MSSRVSLTSTVEIVDKSWRFGLEVWCGGWDSRTSLPVKAGPRVSLKQLIGGPAGTRRVFGARARRPNTPDVSFCPSVVWAVRSRVCRSLFHFEKLHLIHGYYAVTQLAEFSVTQLFATEKTGQQFKRCLARAQRMIRYLLQSSPVH